MSKLSPLFLVAMLVDLAGVAYFVWAILNDASWIPGIALLIVGGGLMVVAARGMAKR